MIMTMTTITTTTMMMNEFIRQQNMHKKTIKTIINKKRQKEDKL